MKILILRIQFQHPKECTNLHDFELTLATGSWNHWRSISVRNDEMIREVSELLDDLYLDIKSEVPIQKEQTLLQLLMGLLRHGLQSEPYLVSQSGWSGLRHIASVIASRRPPHSNWQAPSIEEIIEVVLRNPKFLELGTNQIRARSGHSIRAIRVGDEKDRRSDAGNDNQSELVSKAALRFVLKILRHCAEEYSINLDENGWANVDDLILVVTNPFAFRQYMNGLQVLLVYDFPTSSIVSVAVAGALLGHLVLFRKLLARKTNSAVH